MKRLLAVMAVMGALSLTGLPTAAAVALWATGWPQQGLVIVQMMMEDE